MVLPRTRVDDLENYVELCGTEKYLKIADEIWKTHLKQCNYVQLRNCTWGSTLVLEEVWETTGRRQVNPMKNSMGNKMFRRGI